jgi:soluble lytic murein transglycosylase-like protein
MSRWRAVMTSARVLLAASVIVAAVVVACTAPPAHAADTASTTKPVRVAPASALYRHRIEQAVTRAWGIDGSSARLAAQLHQESGFREGAKSSVGAQGMAQFMPKTAEWIATIYPEDLANFDPWNAQQAILAAALYDKWLLDRVKRYGTQPLDACSRWAFVMRAYNGGETALNREREQARKAGANGNDWRVVEKYRTRAQWAHKENIGYPRRILVTLEPAYVSAGWQGEAVCS